jgi:probable phosphoglycerate mutase
MIIIVRHGQTYWNLEKRKQGHGNSKLTEKGKKQALKIAKYFNKNNLNLNNFILYSSPLKRVIDYAKIINRNLNHKFILKKKLNLSDELKEHKFGLWEGKSDKEIEELFPDQIKKRKLNKWHYKIPQGESYEILYKRVKKFINKRIKFKKNYVIFTHDMVSRVFRGYLMKYKKEKILNSEHKNNSIFICDKKKIKEIRL